jgi:hypothetical protein
MNRERGSDCTLDSDVREQVFESESSWATLSQRALEGLGTPFIISGSCPVLVSPFFGEREGVLIWTDYSYRKTHLLSFSCCPLRLDLDHTFNSGSIVAKAAPGPIPRIVSVVPEPLRAQGGPAPHIGRSRSGALTLLVSSQIARSTLC